MIKRLILSLILILCLCGTGWGGDKYLNGDCPNNGDGTSFSCAVGAGQAGAYNSLANSVSGASAGDTVYISGGASGQTYTTGGLLTVSKNLTLSSVDTASHNGVVTVSGRIVSNANVSMTWKGTLSNRMVIVGTSTTSYIMSANATGTTTVIQDVDVTGTASAAQGALQLQGTWKLRRVHIYDIADATNGSPMQVSGDLGNGNGLTIEYSIIDKHYFSISGTAQTVSLYNNVFIEQAESSLQYALNIPNNAAFTLNATNNIFLGSSPVYTTGTASVITCENNYFHPSNINTASYYATFDNKGNCIPTSRVAEFSLPKLKKVKNSNFGQVFIRIDDVPDLAQTAAETLNPEIPVTFYFGSSGMSSPYLNNLRWLVANGNEVGSHGTTHAHNDTLNILSAAWTGGTSKEIIIDTTQSGDSTTWTGRLKLVVDGISCPDATGWDLSNASYDTVDKIITLLNSGAGHTCNGATVTVANLNGSATATGIKSANLADQTLSGDGNLTLDDTAFLRSELAEDVLNLEAYITGSTSATPATQGCDRNGNNCFAATQANVDSYDCTSYASAGGKYRWSMKAALIASGIKTSHSRYYYTAWEANKAYVPGDIISISQSGIKYYVCTIAGTSGGSEFSSVAIGSTATDNTVTWKRLGRMVNASASDGITAIDLHTLGYEQIDGTRDGVIFSFIARSAVSPTVTPILWHGVPTFNGSTSDLKNMLVDFGVGGETISEYYNRIAGNAHFAHIGNQTYQYDGDNWSVINSSGDYHLTSGSPAINAGINICTGVDTPLPGCTGAGTGTYTDFAGKAVPKGSAPDIGAYEFYPSRKGGVGYFSGGINYNGSYRAGDY